jgi:exodeoxyribonuclease V
MRNDASSIPAAPFLEKFREYMVHEPTACQHHAMEVMTQFLFSLGTNEMLLLNGYAGTGKTTLVSAFVRTLGLWKIRNSLLAPTGRAAKVLGSYAEKKAHTIHRYIYRIYTSPEGKPVIMLRDNKSSNTIYVVDEASMIQGLETGSSDQNEAFSNRNILDDLIRFVYESENCKMVFIGDQAQLPPVGTDISPALNAQLLRSRYNLDIVPVTLSTVVRQAEQSGILANASALRVKIDTENFSPPLLFTYSPDVSVAEHHDLADELSGAFASGSRGSAVVITRSNKRANMYNQEIRYRILGREQEIEGGDLMMVVKNNYFWLPEQSPAGFIANGDMLEVLRIRNIVDTYGFRFADALVRFPDYDGETDFEVRLLLSSISSESASITDAQRKALFLAVREEIDEENRTSPDNRRVLSRDPFYNALHVKFAYALTCHKTQGGQWEKVFVDQGWLPEERIDKEYLRWLYTAVTRATNRLWLVGFNENYISRGSQES